MSLMPLTSAITGAVLCALGRQREFCGLPASLMAARCLASCSKNDTRTFDEGIAVTEESVLPAAAMQAVGRKHMDKLDPSPTTTKVPRVVSRTDTKVLDKASCDIALQYPGVLSQTVTWVGAPCKALHVSVIKPSELKEMGQLDDLKTYDRQDIERHKDGVFYIETDVTSAAYPLNDAQIVREVVLAD